MFGSLMAEVLADDEEDEVGGPCESGWRDAGWRDEKSDDSSLGSVLLASAWADESEEEEDDEKMMEERVAEVTELDEMLAEQESTEASSRLNDDSNLVSYQSLATERRSEQTGLTDERVGRRVVYYLFEFFQNELAWASSLTIACRSMDSEVSCLVLGS